MARPLDFMANCQKQTWVHRLDARVKVFSLLTLVMLSLLFLHPGYLSLIMGVGLVMWVCGRVDMRPLAGLFWGIVIYLIMVFIYSATFRFPNVTVPTVLLTLGPIRVTLEGVYGGLLLCYRQFIPMFLGILLVAVTEPSKLAKGLIRIRVPVEVAFMILGVLRFFPLLFEEASNILDAQTIRGVRRRTLREKVESIRVMALPLFINSLRRSRTLGLSVETKGFGARSWRAFYDDMKLSRLDWVVLVFMVVFTLALLYVRLVLKLGWWSKFQP